MNIALFGGSFDPPHVGHLLASLYVLATEPVDELWLVPVFRHAFGKPLTDFAHRVAMCERMREAFGPRLRVSTVEGELGGVSRTVETVRHLLRQRPGDRFSLVIGTDVLAERQSWYQVEALDQLVGYLVVGRPGHAPSTLVTMPEVSSTEVRRRLAGGEECGHLVPRLVREYITEHGLYR
jgi:nicotinate-nucleotide adenylyltransferase